MQYIDCHKSGSDVGSLVTLKDFMHLKRVPEVSQGGCCYSDRGFTRLQKSEQWIAEQRKPQMRIYLISQMLHDKVHIS